MVIQGRKGKPGYIESWNRHIVQHILLIVCRHLEFCLDQSEESVCLLQSSNVAFVFAWLLQGTLFD